MARGRGRDEPEKEALCSGRGEGLENLESMSAKAHTVEDESLFRLGASPGRVKCSNLLKSKVVQTAETAHSLIYVYCYTPGRFTLHKYGSFMHSMKILAYGFFTK